LKRKDPSLNWHTSRVSVAFAVLHAGFFVASLAAIPLFAPGAAIPNPFGSDEAGRAFVLHNAEAVRASACLQLISAIFLAALGATLANCRQAGDENAMPSALTLAGSIGGAVSLAMAALCSWALGSPGAVDPGSAFRTLQFLPFLMGGPGWAAFFALFLAGVLWSGGKVLAGWVFWAGCFLCVTSGVAVFVMLTIFVSACLPISRFLGFLWLIVAATKLKVRAAHFDE